MKRLALILVVMLVLPASAGAINKGIFFGPGIYQLKLAGEDTTLTGGEGGGLFYVSDTEYINIKGHWASGTIDQYDITQYSGRFTFGYLPLNRPFNVGPVFGLEYLHREVQNSSTTKWDKLFMVGGITGYFQTIVRVRIDMDALVRVPVYKNTTLEVSGQKYDYSPQEHPSVEIGLSLNYWLLSLRAFWQYERQESYQDANVTRPAIQTHTLGATLTIHF